MTIRRKNRMLHNALLWLLLISAFGCDKEKDPIYSGETVTDLDGNVYNTVMIGDQLWMAEDLKVSRYNDGTAITYITEKTAWANSRTGAYCWYNNEESWGALYNWYAVNTAILAPAGWHVPTHQEWTELTDFLGGEAGAGGILKETGGERWGTPNYGATNDYWFTAIPGGLRDLDGTFLYFGGGAYWWSSTEFDPMNSWHRSIFWNASSMNRDHIGKMIGLSVRCVKDQP